MTIKTIRNVLLLTCCTMAFACQGSAYRPSAVDATQFKDVVVPDGFVLKDRRHESYSRVEASWRQGHFVYTGGAGVDEAASYVELSMPRHSWQKVSEQAVGDGGKKIRFERGIYSADYTFRRQDGMTQMVVDYATDYTRR